MEDVSDVNAWIDQLMTCKQLPEAEVKKLCDKVLVGDSGQGNPHGRI
jgi:hypothetical protein